MDIHFDCTMCGRCCHDLKLPLSVDEAIDWIERGGEVSLFCEAIPWEAEPAPDDQWARYKGDRAFPAVSGTLRVRVLVMLVAAQAGPCPFLLPDMRCGAYDHRPRVCRIYPAEINPLIALSPDSKLCPTDAWGDGQPVLVRKGRVVDLDTADLIAQARAAAIGDVPAKALMCATLGIDGAALSNEGFAVHKPPQHDLLAALRGVRAGEVAPAQWALLSNRAETVTMLAEAGAAGVATASSARYIGFFADSLSGDI